VPNEGDPYLLPYYVQANQFGLDLQYIVGDCLWKLEAIQRNSDGNFPSQDFWATTAGFEYTLVGVMEKPWDLGILMEYSYDSRDVLYDGPYQNDLFVGGRLSFNDPGSSEALFGVVQDLDQGPSRAIFLESSTRFGDSTRVVLEAWFFSSAGRTDPFYSYRRDSYLELSVEYYF